MQNKWTMEKNLKNTHFLFSSLILHLLCWHTNAWEMLMTTLKYWFNTSTFSLKTGSDRLITLHTSTTLTEKWCNNNSANLSIWEPTVSSGALQRSFAPISKMTISDAKRETFTKSYCIILSTVLPPTPNNRTNILNVKVTFRGIIKLMLQVAFKVLNERMTKYHCFWDTQSHFGLKRKQVFKRSNLAYA